jgi:GNAT superfamily N-acetyltransferase
MLVVIRPAERFEAQAVASGLHEFNVSHIGPFSFQALSLAAIDDGQLVGGVLAQTGIGWLQVESLWVADGRRGLGIGRALLAAAEAEAWRRGCRGAFVDTFDWQAEPFYRRQGYEVFGRLEDCPSSGHVRTSLRKMLKGAPAGG